MASGRIIHKDLFLNEDLSELNVEERFLYIGTIVFSDDDGRMKASPIYLKASIFPLDTKLPIEKIKLWRDNLASKNLIGLYLAGGKEYIFHPNWTKWQSLRKDRYHPSDCPNPDKNLPLGNQLATIGQPSATEPNLTEPNLTEPTTKPTHKLQTYIDRWNSILPTKVLSLSRGRREHLVARTKEAVFVDKYDIILKKIADSDFLMGRFPRVGEHKNWKPTFDWLIKNDDNYTKILEGKYDGQTKKERGDL